MPQERQASKVLWLRKAALNHNVQFAAVVLLIAALRCVYLDADPGGHFFNSDEGHQNSDARSILLYGTPFSDSYNPSILMPAFTLFKFLFFAAMGLNLWAMRLPSVLCVGASSWLVAYMLARRGHVFAAWGSLVFIGVSYFFYVHARIGNHEALMMVVTVAMAVCLEAALEEGRVRAYLGAAALAVVLPLVKLSGVFSLGVLALVGLYAFCFDRERFRVERVLGAVLLMVGMIALLLLCWVMPNWAQATEYFNDEVVSKASFDLPKSLVRTGKMMFVVSVPVLGGSALGAIFFFVRLLKERRLQSCVIVYLAWLFSALAPIMYSNYLPPRFMMWVMPAAVVVMMLALERLPRVAGRILLLLVIIATVALDYRGYRSFFAHRTYHIAEFTPVAEKILRDELISGSGVNDFAAFSSTIQVYTERHLDWKTTCDQRRKFFREIKPTYISVYIGQNPQRALQRLDVFLARSHEMISGCPEFNLEYRPYLFVHHSRKHRTYNLWFVRKGFAPPPAPSIEHQLRSIAGMCTASRE